MKDVIFLDFNLLFRWQSVSQTTNQPDALDEVDTGHLPQAHAAHHKRRLRQVRRVYPALLPRGEAPFCTESDNISARGI